MAQHFEPDEQFPPRPPQSQQDVHSGSIASVEGLQIPKPSAAPNLQYVESVKPTPKPSAAPNLINADRPEAGAAADTQAKEVVATQEPDDPVPPRPPQSQQDLLVLGWIPSVVAEDLQIEIHRTQAKQALPKATPPKNMPNKKRRVEQAEAEKLNDI